MTTVAVCWAAYVEGHLSKTCAPATNARYWGRLKWFADLDAEALSPKEVETYVVQRQIAGAKIGTINREFSLLGACLKWCELHRIISRAPQVKKLPKPSPKMRALNRKEASRIILAADQGNWREQVYVRLALGTAQRPGAIVELKWEQVDLKNKTIDFRTDDPRRKKRALVPFSDMVAKALSIADANRDGEYVLHYRGKKLSSPRPLMKRVADAAGIKDCPPHVLRHTVASILLQEGEELLKVSRLLGHASTTITEQVYFQHETPWLRKTTKRLKF